MDGAYGSQRRVCCYTITATAVLRAESNAETKAGFSTIAENLVVTFSIITRGVKHIQCARFYNTVYDSTVLFTPHQPPSPQLPVKNSRGLSKDTAQRTHVPRLPPPVALNQTLNLVKRFSPVAGRSSARQTQEDG